MTTFSCQCGAVTMTALEPPPPCVGCDVCQTSLIHYAGEGFSPLAPHQWGPIDEEHSETRECRVCGRREA